jgi:hypothetical protein
MRLMRLLPQQFSAMARVLTAVCVSTLCLILLAPVFVVGGALFLFASCVHAIGRLLEPHFVPWLELMTFDPQLGWRPRPGLDAHYLAHRDDVFHVVTDREGWPGSRSLDDSAVVVIGDSFAFGYGVDTGRSFADLNPRLTIKGVGAPGYSMVQSVLLMEQFAERLAGKLVVWFVCLENDLEDNLRPAMGRYRAPFARPSREHAGWEIAHEHVGPSPWQCSNLGNKRLLPHLCVSGPLADRAYAACDYLIGLASASCSRVGAHLVLVTVPDPIQLTSTGRARLAALSGRPESCDENLPDLRIAESCGRYRVPLIVGKHHLSAADYKRLESLHWNERGHRRMADVLGRVYESFRAGALSGFAPNSFPIGRDLLAILNEFPAGRRVEPTVSNRLKPNPLAMNNRKA